MCGVCGVHVSSMYVQYGNVEHIQETHATASASAVVAVYRLRSNVSVWSE